MSEKMRWTYLMALKFYLVVLLLPLLTATEDGADFPYIAADPLPVDIYDYDYYNYQGDGSVVVDFKEEIKNSTLFKCFCQANEEWDGNSCYEQRTIVLVGHNLYTGKVYNTTDFGRVVVTGPPHCEHPSMPLILDSRLDFRFLLLGNGSLSWNTVFSNYCIEHTPGSNWLAHVCLPPPVVPTCCAPGHDFEENECVARTLGTFSPPVLVETELKQWEAQEAGPVEVNCPDETDELRLVLDSKNASLLFHHGGTILQWFPQTNNPTFQDEYCVTKEPDSKGSSHYVAKVCYKDPLSSHWEACNNHTCVRKCCPEGQYHTLQGCLPASDESHLMELSFYEHIIGEVSPTAEAPNDLKFVIGYPLCGEYFLMEPHKTETDEFYLMTDGTLYIPVFNSHYEPHRYCLENFVDQDNVTRLLPLVCFHEKLEESTACEAMQSYLYPILLLVSCVFLGITLLIYVSVPELHAKVHGKCLVSHVSALLLAYCSLITVKWATKNLPIIACQIMASVIHMSFLAAFFWLNVMCFDIWWTLKSMRPVAESGEQSRFRFKMYSIYSWGCPLIIAVVSIIVQKLPEEMDVIRPNFGVTKCWFDNNTSLWIYFYGFVLTLVIANIIFFCQVAYILIMAQNDPILQRTRQQNRERMWLYVKLFLVMGITWLAEVISWQEGSCEAWVVTDIINSLQGFSIFLIFICKKNMLKKIRGKWDPYLRRMKEFVGSTRLSQSGNASTSQVHSSFSSSSQRPSQSYQSQRTVQSQVSLDSSSTRRLSASSLSPVTGVQVHNQSKTPMQTIAETSSPETEYDESGNVVASFPSPGIRSNEQQRISSSSGNSTADETSQMISHSPNGSEAVFKVVPEQSENDENEQEDTKKTSLNSAENNESPKTGMEDKGNEKQNFPNVQMIEASSQPVPHNGVQETQSEAVKSGICSPVISDSNVTCVLPSSNHDGEPITINGEIPQLVDNSSPHSVNGATVVKIDEDESLVNEKVFESKESADLSKTGLKDDQEKVERSDGYQERQSLGLYEYDDEYPVNV